MIIYPIELLLEVVFSIMYKIWGTPGIAIIGVSLVVNLLMLPLYNRADLISEKERSRQKEMKPWIDHIKRVFKGDERFMMLNAYYRKQEYHPLYALRSSLPLLLQIPFFIAAYHFLSHLSRLDGRIFLCIKDLGRPDAIINIPAIGIDIYPEMIMIPGFIINILPILMTLINIISVIIYTKGSPLKEKIQLYVMAFLFLILLYDSPSGLVVYWTMNNIFSLLKNIAIKIRKRTAVKGGLGPEINEREVSMGAPSVDPKRIHILTFSGAVLMTILIGVVIPSSVIVSSPSEFVITCAYRNPLQYIVSTSLISAGLFLIWFPVFYYLASDKTRRGICGLVWISSGIFLTDFLVFGNIDKYVTSELKYDSELFFSHSAIVINIAVLAVIAGIFIYIWRVKPGWMKMIYISLILGLAGLAGFNVVSTEKSILQNIHSLKNTGSDGEGFTISRQGKNVIVIMLDQEIGTYIPFMLAERPELKEKYAGFTYYPNVVSHGGKTLTGSPGLFGGYEYTPEMMDKRDEEKLVDKQDEALKVMPVIFSENGYQTTVYDPPLAGYEWVSDLSIYDDYPDIHAASLKNKFLDPATTAFIEKYRRRSFFMYGVHKVVPTLLQSFIYDNGEYLYPDILTYPSMSFFDSISVLENLDKLTRIEDGSQNTFMIMDNESAHWPTELQLPDYSFSGNVNNRNVEYKERCDLEGNIIEFDGYMHYHSNMAAIIQLGEWLDYLKMNGVYDNTRIIVVSDHGYATGGDERLILEDGTDIQLVIPLLMYKDFYAEEYNESDEFMTNADTPTLALSGLIEDPVNPFTGEKINDSMKKSHNQLILYKDGLEPDKERTSFYKEGQKWYSVHDNVYDSSDWTRIDPLNYEY